MHTRFPKIPAPYRFPEGTEYVAVRSITVNGTVVPAGSPLPKDVLLHPRRIETLVRLRYLAPRTMQEVDEEDDMPEIAAAQPCDISAMTGAQLKLECRRLGLNPYGNKAELRKRILSTME